VAIVEQRPSRARLRRSDTSGPGLRRVRRGRSFQYLDDEGEGVEDPEVLQRIDELVIPPAWRDVWICPYPGGHIQATGIDQAGRKQYLYHPRWRERRDQQKFDEMLEFAQALPALREYVEARLALDDLSREHVLAVAVRLLDRGFFRIGSEDYAVRNETYGLATMKKRHVRLRGDVLLFDYPAKHGKRRVQAVIDPTVARTVERLKRRRGGGDELLAHKASGRWYDVRSADINGFLKEATGLDVSAKDFRTWGATVLAAVALAVAGEAPPASKTARKRAVTRAVKEVAHYLGNTPAVARASYIDPRVFDRFADGDTVAPGLVAAASDRAGEATAIQGPVEEAVLELLTSA
jgi:DNA topoisomerase-1